MTAASKSRELRALRQEHEREIARNKSLKDRVKLLTDQLSKWLEQDELDAVLRCVESTNPRLELVSELVNKKTWTFSTATKKFATTLFFYRGTPSTCVR